MKIIQLTQWSLTVLIIIGFALCDDICIVPLKNTSNIGSCLMISDFAENASSNSGPNDTVRLFLQPGIHSLNVNLSLSGIYLFSMESVNRNPQDTIIKCTDLVGLKFDSVLSMKWSGISFNNCSQNQISLTGNFRLQHSVFLADPIARELVDFQTRPSAALILYNSSVYIQNTSFAYFTGSLCGVCPTTVNRSIPVNDVAVGGAIISVYCNMTIFNSIFYSNTAQSGGAVYVELQSNITLLNSSFSHHNMACEIQKCYGGVIFSDNSNLQVTQCNFSMNTNFQTRPGWNTTRGVIASSYGNISINGSIFSENAALFAGTLYFEYCDVKIFGATFLDNRANTSAGIAYFKNCSVVFQKSNVIGNRAARNAGAIQTHNSITHIIETTFKKNSAGYLGGAIMCSNYQTSKLIVDRSVLSTSIGSAIYSKKCDVIIMNVQFTNNSADTGAAMYIIYGRVECDYNNSFIKNSGNFGIVTFLKTKGSITGHFSVRNNTGSILVIDSQLNIGVNNDATFSSHLNKPKSHVESKSHEIQEGGGMTSILSTITLYGTIVIKQNNAINGGGILAISSTILISSIEIYVSRNTVENTGGGIYLYQSKLIVEGKVTVSNNSAEDRGGGLHSISSIVTLRLVYKNKYRGKPYSYLYFINNSADKGGGACLELNSKFYITNRTKTIKFINNTADFGGAVYVNDETLQGTCSSNTQTIAAGTESECFFQSISMATDKKQLIIENDMDFRGNSATSAGSVLFGGLLDRCTVNTLSPTEGEKFTRLKYSDQANFINNILNETTSKAVRICFCHNHSIDCSYQVEPIQVMKGERFSIQAVPVDHVNHTVSANIFSYLYDKDSALGNGEQVQRANVECTNLSFRVYTRNETELLTLYADGPCGDAKLSQRQITISFLPCTCAVGFQPLEAEVTNCKCVCDSRLESFISECDPITNLLQRTDDFWITLFQENNSYSYFVYPHCPFDYCFPPSETVNISLINSDGANAQCANNRTGLLCGSCQKDLSLSLGSSKCISCPKHWIANFLGITLSACVLGAMLAFIILLLNLTVATGELNGIIFYANVLAANKDVFLPFQRPNFITVILAWLNLDIGFNICYFNGLDSYAKVWIELSFPIYIILLVAFIIYICKYSRKLSMLLSKKNPVSTLATLILLSYTKLFQSIIVALAYAVLKYPNGSSEVVWRLDATVGYIKSKHVFIFLTALIIFMFGVAYMLLLFSWQWLLRLSHLRLFKWVQNSKLIVFMDAYHAPFTPQGRYWSGLLLIARGILYILSAVNVSKEPKIDLLAVNIVVSLLFLLKYKIYKNWLVDIQETLIYVNLIMFSGAKLYLQRAKGYDALLAYLSTSVAFAILLCIIFYHVIIGCIPISVRSKMKKYVKQAIKPHFRHNTINDLAVPFLCKNSESQSSQTRKEISYSEIQLTSMEYT